MTKRALITGISGQDGSYLAEYLVDIGYDVYGIVRRNSIPENQTVRVQHLMNSDKITCFYGDLTDISSIMNAMIKSRPDEIYNLAAQSHVKISFEIPYNTCETNVMGILNMLEAYRNVCPDAKFYQAGSSEMFGNSVDSDGFQRETTPFNPVSPYACSKVFGHNLVKNYRNAYNLKAYNGILFNHESPRRGINFITNKVAKTAVEIKLGKKDKLVIGSMDSCRDWGHAKDYVRVMHMMLNESPPDDFLIATGKTRSVKDLCDCVFSYLGMDYRKYIVQDKKYFRPEELDYLRGDMSKAKSVLGWEPEYTFEQMMHEMVDHWLNHFSE